MLQTGKESYGMLDKTKILLWSTNFGEAQILIDLPFCSM